MFEKSGRSAKLFAKAFISTLAIMLIMAVFAYSLVFVLPNVILEVFAYGGGSEEVEIEVELAVLELTRDAAELEIANINEEGDEFRQQTLGVTEQEILDKLAELNERARSLHEWFEEVSEVLTEVPEYTVLGEFRLSAYCLCVECTGAYSYGYEDNADNPYSIQVTASGTIPTDGRTIAADGRFPFGTEIYIEGLGWRTVEDRGGAIRGLRLDIFMPSHQAALEFGIQRAEVRVRTVDLDKICPTLVS